MKSLLIFVLSHFLQRELMMNRQLNSLCFVVLVAAIATMWSATAIAQAPVSSGDIFFDDFTGPAGSLTTADPNYDQVFGTVALNGTTFVTTAADLPSLSAARSRLLDFSSSPNEWVGSTRFQVTGTLDTPHEFPRQVNLFSGTNSAFAPFGDTYEHFGFDVRAEEVVANGTGTGSTFNMTWFGWDSIDSSREGSPISGASGLNKGQFYDLTLHRKTDDMIDVYLDDNLIDTFALIVGDAGGSNPGEENPHRLEFGVLSGAIAADVTFDFFSIGSVAEVEAVPEPTSIAIWATIGLGLCGFAFFRRRRMKRGK